MPEAIEANCFIPVVERVFQVRTILEQEKKWIRLVSLIQGFGLVSQIAVA